VSLVPEQRLLAALLVLAAALLLSVLVVLLWRFLLLLLSLLLVLLPLALLCRLLHAVRLPLLGRDGLHAATRGALGHRRERHVLIRALVRHCCCAAAGVG
jgi:hypothetical protein